MTPSESGSFTMSKVKDLVKMAFVIEIVVTVLFFAAHGVEGTARVFCDMFPTDTCEEIEWQDEQE